MHNLTNPAKVRVSRLIAVFFVFATMARSEVWISEILFNPPGTDLPNEYIELRGTPNLILPAGTYFVVVEGDATGPGTIQNVFDLSGRAIGGNGFLVLLENSNTYSLNTNCFALINTNGSGFGNSTASVTRHRGDGGRTDLGNGSSTFFLIQSTNVPALGGDIDANNDGTPDGAIFASWTVLDSVAVLDDSGSGDIGYGKINFRHNAAATVVAGTVIAIAFDPVYVARTGNTTNWAAGAWLASGNLSGTSPNWSLDSVQTEPIGFQNRALNHIGGPNFGAPAVPGLVARETGFSTDLIEGLPGLDSYTLGLNTAPIGSVNVRINAGPQVQVSIDAGASFGASRTVVFADTSPVTVLVRGLDDNIVDSSPHTVPILHAITASADTAHYPVGAPAPVVNVNIVENDTLLLSELKVNPPGPEDAPYEFIELRGAPNALLTNVYVLAVEGNKEQNPGTVNIAIDLTGERLGSSGLLLLAADGHPYNVPTGTRVFLASELSAPGGALGNGSISFLLVSSPSRITPGSDWDAGDNGVLEGLPAGATILDSVAWLDGGSSDRVYSPAVLSQSSGTPDAATRFPANTNANSAAAWTFGDLEGGGDSLIYESGPNVPYGTQLTPGGVNNTAPRIVGATAFSSVIGDPTSPVLIFQISDAESALDILSVSVTSSDQSVVPDANLLLAGSGGTRTLSINPVGVGYATILLAVSDGNMTGLAPIQYAASADLRGNGRFHTGVSDASTALALDSNYMLVGDDENQVLRIFSRSNSGPAIARFDMNPFLDLKDFYANGTPREIDLEGSTRVGNRIYWIGSHSHSRDFDVRTNRARLFATDLSGTGTNSALTFLGHYDFLKFDLMNWDASNGHGRGANFFGLTASGDPGVDPKAPDGSGFNIEGLAMAPGSTNIAYVCFRAPLVPATNRAKALIVPVTTFPALASSRITNAGAAQFGTPIELNLGGRGIRSIEGGSNGYLIVAGPPGIASGLPPADFRLFTWNGFSTNAPQERSASLTNMIPEGIVDLPPAPWTSNSVVQLISDNGITVFYNDDIEAKFLPVKEFKKFRSDWVTLGSAVTSRPVIKSIERSGDTCVVTWYSVAGITYRLQSKSALGDSTWSDVTGDVTASDALASKTVSIPGSAQKFFRVAIP